MCPGRQVRSKQSACPSTSARCGRRRLPRRDKPRDSAPACRATGGDAWLVRGQGTGDRGQGGGRGQLASAATPNVMPQGATRCNRLRQSRPAACRRHYERGRGTLTTDDWPLAEMSTTGLRQDVFRRGARAADPSRRVREAGRRGEQRVGLIVDVQRARRIADVVADDELAARFVGCRQTTRRRPPPPALGSRRGRCRSGRCLRRTGRERPRADCS